MMQNRQSRPGARSRQVAGSQPAPERTRPRPATRDVFVAFAFFLGSLVLYVVTTAPSVATIFDDSLEFQVVLPTLGIAHPSGYPLYTLAGKAATFLIPLRDPAGRTNLLSALTAALAIGFLYPLARRVGGSRLGAAVTTAVFAISPVWWSQATLAEVYAPHGLLMILFLYLLLRWEEEHVVRIPSDPQPTTDRWLGYTALVAGLGLAHHRMIALLFPAALLLVLWTDPSLLRRPRRWLKPLLLALAPLLLYLYLPIRGQTTPSLDGTYSPTLRGTLEWILARGYSVFLTSNPFGVSRSIGDFVALFTDQFGVFLLLAALWSLITGWRLVLRRYLFLLLATVPTLAFGAAYKVQDVSVFLIPAFILVTLWAAWGLTPLFDGVAVYGAGIAHRLLLPRWIGRLLPGALAALAAAILVFEPARLAWEEFPVRDRSQTWSVYDQGMDMIAHVEPGGRVVGLLGETTLLRYFRDVLGLRPDIALTAADDEAARYEAVEAALARGEPVYLTRDLPGAASRYSLDAVGPLIAVSAKATPGAPPSGQDVGMGILLREAKTDVRTTHAGPVVRLTLAWAPTMPITEELKVSARLVGESGKVLAADDQVPVHFAYPTTAWVAGETIQDVYDLPLPADAATKPYGLLLILYRAVDASEVGRIRLPPTALPP